MGSFLQLNFKKKQNRSLALHCMLEDQKGSQRESLINSRRSNSADVQNDGVAKVPQMDGNLAPFYSYQMGRNQMVQLWATNSGLVSSRRIEGAGILVGYNGV